MVKRVVREIWNERMACWNRVSFDCRWFLVKREAIRAWPSSVPMHIPTNNNSAWVDTPLWMHYFHRLIALPFSSTTSHSSLPTQNQAHVSPLFFFFHSSHARGLINMIAHATHHYPTPQPTLSHPIPNFFLSFHFSHLNLNNQIPATHAPIKPEHQPNLPFN